jgi:hypothetical protein
MTNRWTRRWADEHGFCASCRCGWTTRRNTRQQRDQDVDCHEVDHVWRDTLDEETVQ